MTLPASGALAMSQVRTELSVGSALNLSNASVRALASIPPGSVSMSNLRGKTLANASLVPFGYFQRLNPDFVVSLVPGSGSQLVALVRGSYMSSVVTGIYRNGGVAYSNDSGATWTRSTSFESLFAMLESSSGSIASMLSYKNGRFVVVSDNNIAGAYSDDGGTTWASMTVGASVPIVKSNGSMFIAIGGNATTGVGYSSTDGVTWTVQASFASAWNLASTDPRAAVWTGSRFIAVGYNKSVYSTDGITWTAGTLTGGIDATSITSSGGLNAVLGDSSGYLLTTSDGGVTWSQVTTFRTMWGLTPITDLIWTGSAYIAVGPKGKCARSTDGTNWSMVSLTSVLFGGSVHQLALSGGNVIAAGTTGAVLRSTDHGATWSQLSIVASAPANRQLPVVSGHHDGTTYRMVGHNGVLLESTNGLDWALSYISGATNQPNYQESAYGLSAIAKNPAGRFVVVGWAGSCRTSLDGITWSVTNSLGSVLVSAGVLALVWANNQFVVTANSGKCATSPDGVTWTARTLATVVANTAMTGLVWSGTHYIALAATRCAYSTDGITWTAATTSYVAAYTGGGAYSYATNGAGTTVVVNQSPTSNTDVICAYTTNSTTWASASASLQSVLNNTSSKSLRVWWNGSMFMVIDTLRNQAAKSADGITWTTATLSATFNASDSILSFAAFPNGKVFLGFNTGYSFFG